MKNRNSFKIITFLLLTISPLFLLGANRYHVGDTLYVWARSGLNMRDSGNLKAKKIQTLPYGTQVLVLESKYSHADGAAFNITVIKQANLNEVKYPGYQLNGDWVRVKVDSIEGYLFDGFLSKFPPLEVYPEEIGDKKILLPREYPTLYFERVFGKLKTYNPQTFYEWQEKQRIIFGDGSLYEYTSYEAAGTDKFIIQDMDLEEAYLFFNMSYFLERSNQPEDLHGESNFIRLNIKEDRYLNFTIDELGSSMEIRQIEDFVIVTFEYAGC